MKIITKRDLAVVRAISLLYPEVCGITIKGYMPGIEECAMVRIPGLEKGEEILVRVKDGKPTRIFLPPPDVMMSYRPIEYEIRDGVLHRV